MANNRDLLKEAIADAKAVKETAIANAKAALEESFGPFLREKLSQKISEMEETDEGMMTYANQEMEEEMDEVSLDELLAELEENEVEEELYEAKKEEKEEKEEEEEMSIEDMSEDDLKSFIENVIQDMIGAGELEAGHEGMENEEGAEELDERNMYSKKNTTKMKNYESLEEIDLNELLNELELEEETLNEMASFYKIKASVDQEKAKSIFKRAADVTPEGSAMHDILSSLAKTGEADLKKFSMEQGGKDMAKWNNVPNRKKLEGDGFFAKYLDAGSSPSNKGGQGKKGGVDRYDFLKGEEGGEEFTQDLEEAYSVIETLKSELNEINVLNAKLLYTNKIFRNKSLTESQKIKVLTAFDKATTKKEVELIYETLQGGLKASIATKSPIRESLGSASKALGNASVKPIIENDAFSRMRELAFGKK